MKNNRNWQIYFGIFFFIVFLSELSCYSQNIENSIVPIYAIMENGKVSQGTGFYISSDGRIMTAYHVIINAKRIWTADKRGNVCNDLFIESLAPSCDLAILKFNPSSKGPFPYLKINDNYIPRSGQDVEIFGWPRNISNIHLYGKIIRDNFLNSHQLKYTNNTRIFNSEMDLIIIGVESFKGISGAPVLSNGYVVGIINGSLIESGQMTWAIPAKYSNIKISINRHSSNMTTWPKFSMINGEGWNELRSWYTHNVQGEQEYNKYSNLVEVALIQQQKNQEIARKLIRVISQYRLNLSLFSEYLNYENLLSSQDELLVSIINEEAQLKRQLFESINSSSEICTKILLYDLQVKDILNNLNNNPQGQYFDKKIKNLGAKAYKLSEKSFEASIIENEILEKNDKLLITEQQLVQELRRYSLGSNQRKVLVDQFIECRMKGLSNTEEECNIILNGKNFLDYSISMFEISKSIFEIRIFQRY